MTFNAVPLNAVGGEANLVEHGQSEIMLGRASEILGGEPLIERADLLIDRLDAGIGPDAGPAIPDHLAKIFGFKDDTGIQVGRCGSPGLKQAQDSLNAPVHLSSDRSDRGRGGNLVGSNRTGRLNQRGRH